MININRSVKWKESRNRPSCMVKSFLTKVPIQFISERKIFSKNDAGTIEYTEEKVT